MSTTWASAVLSQDVCGLCGENFSAAGSKWCQGCERAMLQTSIDQAARSADEPLLYKSSRRELRDSKFWTIFVWFAAATITFAALYELFNW